MRTTPCLHHFILITTHNQHRESGKNESPGENADSWDLPTCSGHISSKLSQMSYCLGEAEKALGTLSIECASLLKIRDEVRELNQDPIQTVHVEFLALLVRFGEAIDAIEQQFRIHQQRGVHSDTERKITTFLPESFTLLSACQNGRSGQNWVVNPAHSPCRNSSIIGSLLCMRSPP